MVWRDWNSHAAIWASFCEKVRLRASCARGTYSAGADVPRLAALDDVVERFHDLLPWGVAIQAVDLQDVQVRAKAGDAGVHSVEDVFP